MKFYYVGRPMALPNPDERAIFLSNKDARKIFENQIILTEAPTLLYKNYNEARQAALAVNDQPCPIFTVEYKLQAGQNAETLPRTFSVSPAQIEFLQASFAHVENGQIYEMQEEEDEDDPLLDDILNAIEERRKAQSDKASTQPNPKPSVPTTPRRVTALRLMIAATVGAGFWYFASQSSAEALFSADTLAQAPFLKELGLSLVAGAGTYFVQKLNAVKNLQKATLKKAIPLSISFIESLFKKEPQKPDVFQSPDAEFEFNGNMKSFKKGNLQTYKIFVSTLVDKFYGDPIRFDKSLFDEENKEEVPAKSNTLLFQAPEAAPRPQAVGGEQQAVVRDSRREYNLRRKSKVDYRGM